MDLFTKTNLRAPNKVLLFAGLLTLICAAACSRGPAPSRDVKAEVSNALNQTGLRDVKVDQDRDKGVVTLSGDVTSEGEKALANQVAENVARGQVIANQVSVRPPGLENEAKRVQSNLDSAIEDNFKAALIANRLVKGVDYKAKEGVFTLRGKVNSPHRRDQLQQLAASIPNVKQVVNEIQIEGQKATSTVN